MESNKTKSVIMTFIPLLVAICLQAAVNFIDIVIVFISRILSKETSKQGLDATEVLNRALNQPMNRAFVMLLMHLTFALVFGIWYYRRFVKNESLSFRIGNGIAELGIKKLPILILCGFLGQLFTDAALVLARGFFPKAFYDYDQMLAQVVGVSSSWLSLTASFFVAPIAEELLFRGVILSYAKEWLPPMPAVLLSALFFGLYHGNIIQFCYAFLLGTALGAVAYRFNNLMPGILLHMCINLSLLIVPDISTLPVPANLGIFAGGLLLFLLLLFFIAKPLPVEKK